MTDHFAGDPRTNRERMLAGDLYVADDPENARRAQRAVRLADAYHRASVQDQVAALPLLAELLGSLGEGAFVKPPLFVDYGEHLHIGARTFVNHGLVALDVATITVGADCQIGPNVQLLTPTHPLEPGPRRDRLEAAKPVTIGDNVWIGGGAIVLPGCRSATTASWGRDPWSRRTCPPGARRRQPSPGGARAVTEQRARRTDPHRRERIVEATVECIAEHGVAGTSHRRVAQLADVPLGSMTYHFAGMDELLREAFTTFARRIEAAFAERLGQGGADEVLDAVVDLVHVDLQRSRAEHVLTYELYTLAARRPEFREITQSWMHASREVLGRVFDPVTARRLDAYVEGAALHIALDPDPQPREQTRTALRLLAGR